MNQSKVVNRIEEICKEFDSRAVKIGVLPARLELAKTLAECESPPTTHEADVAGFCPACASFLFIQPSRTICSSRLCNYIEQIKPA